MLSKAPKKKRTSFRNLATLPVLVAFVFAIMLLSIIIAGIVIFLLVRIGALTLVGERNIIASLIFLLLTSLGMGSIFAVAGGTYFLRPLRILNDATQEISAGNFDVRVEETGTYEMHRLIGSFNMMAKELGSIETLRSDFVQNVSHEFKTPASTIQGFVKLLKHGNLTAEQRNEYLDIIGAEAERLAQLSGNVLLLSRLDNTERWPQKNTFSLDEQLRRTVLQFEARLESKSLSFEADIDNLKISANEELLKEVWLNLIGNAIKFTPPGGTIKITASGLGKLVVVTVEDNGIGMSPEVQKHVFDKFYQGDTSHATEGNGLGLSLAKRIVELCGGEITVSGSEGEGSAFKVVLPRE